jgi:uncharacterized membrane protein YkoI
MKPIQIVAALVQGALIAAPAFAQKATAAPKSDVPADLAKEAKISLQQARITALGAVPGGKIQSEELEREKGRFGLSLGTSPR